MRPEQPSKVTKLVSGEPVTSIQICVPSQLIFFHSNHLWKMKKLLLSVFCFVLFCFFTMLLQSMKEFWWTCTTINTFFLFYYIHMHSLILSFNKYLLNAYYISRTVSWCGFKWATQTKMPDLMTHIFYCGCLYQCYVKDLASYSNMPTFPLKTPNF